MFQKWPQFLHRTSITPSFHEFALCFSDPGLGFPLQSCEQDNDPFSAPALQWDKTTHKVTPYPCQPWTPNCRHWLCNLLTSLLMLLMLAPNRSPTFEQGKQGWQRNLGAICLCSGFRSSMQPLECTALATEIAAGLAWLWQQEPLWPTFSSTLNSGSHPSFAKASDYYWAWYAVGSAFLSRLQTPRCRGSCLQSIPRWVSELSPPPFTSIITSILTQLPCWTLTIFGRTNW